MKSEIPQSHELWQKSVERRKKEKALSDKYRGKDKPMGAEPVRDEDMFTAATTRAEAASFQQDRRRVLLKQAMAQHGEGLEEMEVLTASEFMDKLIEKTRSVTAKLEDAKMISQRLHDKAAKEKQDYVAIKDTRKRINSLDNKIGALLAMLRKSSVDAVEADRAIGRGENMLFPKPAEWDDLMADEGIFSIPEPKVFRQTAVELKRYEIMLQEDSQEIEGNVSDMIDDMNAQEALKERSSKGGTIVLAMDYSENTRPIISRLMRDEFEELKKVNDQINSIKLNAGMASPEATA